MSLDSFRTLGRTGLRASPVTLGTITSGDGGWGADEGTSFSILDAYTAAGGNIIDVANVYTAGGSQRVIGRYLAARPGLRDQLVIALKFSSAMSEGDPHSGAGAARRSSDNWKPR